MKCSAFGILAYFVSFLIIVFLLCFFDVSEALEVVSTADIFLAVSAFLLSGVVLFLKACRWHMILLNSGHKPKISYSCVSMFLGLFASFLTPGKVGEPVRAYFLKKMNNDRMSGTVPLVVIERVVDVAVLVLISLAGTLLFISGAKVVHMHFFEIFAVVMFVVLGVIFVFLNKKVVFFVVGKLNDVFRLGIDETIFYSAVAKVKSGSFLWSLILATVIVWFFEGLVLFVSLLSLGLFLSPVVCFAVVSISFLVGTVTFLPGGLGSLEATLLFLLSFFGLSITAVVAGVVLYRAFSYMMFLILGVFSMYFFGVWSGENMSG